MKILAAVAAVMLFAGSTCTAYVTPVTPTVKITSSTHGHFHNRNYIKHRHNSRIHQRLIINPRHKRHRLHRRHHIHRY